MLASCTTHSLKEDEWENIEVENARKEAILNAANTCYAPNLTISPVGNKTEEVAKKTNSNNH